MWSAATPARIHRACHIVLDSSYSMNGRRVHEFCQISSAIGCVRHPYPEATIPDESQRQPPTRGSKSCSTPSPLAASSVSMAVACLDATPSSKESRLRQLPELSLVTYHPGCDSTFSGIQRNLPSDWEEITTSLYGNRCCEIPVHRSSSAHARFPRGRHIIW